MDQADPGDPGREKCGYNSTGYTEYNYVLGSTKNNQHLLHLNVLRTGSLRSPAAALVGWCVREDLDWAGVDGLGLGLSGYLQILDARHCSRLQTQAGFMSRYWLLSQIGLEAPENGEWAFESNCEDGSAGGFKQ